MIPVNSITVGNEQYQANNNKTYQSDLFLYKGRECKSAPVQSLKRSDSMFSESQSSSFSSDSSIDSTNKKKQKKRTYRSVRKVFYFFFGHAPEFTLWTASFSSSSRIKYLFLFFFESVFRSIGDVTFCSNPFSGLLIFMAMIISTPYVAFLAFITLSFGIETAVVLLRVPINEVRSGGVLFNSFLTGIVIGLLAHENVIVASPHIILTCMCAGILTAFIWRGLNGFFAASIDFPLLNAPFHVSILLYMYSGVALLYKGEEIELEEIREMPIAMNNLSLGGYSILNDSNILNNINGNSNEISQAIRSSNAIESLSWERVVYGILLAPSQVFGTKNLTTSLMIYFSVFLYSPIMLMQSLTGSGLGTLIGILLNDSNDFIKIYNGSWGYNSLFTSAALGGFFVIFNVYSWLWSIVGSILTALLYSAMVKCGLPALGIPFMLTTWLLLPHEFVSPESDHKGDYIEMDQTVNQGPLLRLHLADVTTPEGNRLLLRRDANSNKENDKLDPTLKYSQPYTPSTLQNNSVLPL